MSCQYVEVAWYDGHTGCICGLQVGLVTVAEALRILELEFIESYVGVNGKLVAGDYLLNEGDRIALYPPLLVDPKEKRRRLLERRSNNK
ncbi:RnfH family protein [Candidatus Synchoanobacter obligatus]|uniref:RnfH family protein n=1 Tax=Candidatus Synchoanobacter obligatus TaxID=2919597 RepID=A0ABT1L5D4_9GAMM|nr:RnfH family protein [Candidatus Synchoanobacter obligatus]MCP8352073.1 RnfH family protein [Candidatus Synchoanobacter obligatus]